HQRWTPVQTNLVLLPGDWVRTDARGANAVALRVVQHTRLILGPGATVELLKPNQIRVLAGEVETSLPANLSIELLGPDGQKVTVKGRQVHRAEGGRLGTVAKEPLWLKGFKGTVANESIGSLVALVDGRNVPLTVGEHKVSVDVRDQVARTVIEET